MAGVLCCKLTEHIAWRFLLVVFCWFYFFRIALQSGHGYLLQKKKTRVKNVKWQPRSRQLGNDRAGLGWPSVMVRSTGKVGIQPSLEALDHLYLMSAPLEAAAVTQMSHPSNLCLPGQQNSSVPEGLGAALPQWGRWVYQAMDSRSESSSRGRDYWEEVEHLTDGARVWSQGMLGSCPL